MTPRSISRFLFVLVAASTATIVHAQTGTIGGRVTDSTTSAPLSGASVRAMSGSDDCRAPRLLADDGAYRIVNVAPGTYDVVVTRHRLRSSAASPVFVWPLARTCRSTSGWRRS